MKTPTDTPVAEKRRVPVRGRRFRLLGEGDGDFCIYRIADGSDDMPKGTLLAIHGVPRFESVSEAKRWMRRESKDTLAGFQVMIFKAFEICSVATRTQTSTVIEFKEKTMMKGAEE